jgi:hypothetical protein
MRLHHMEFLIVIVTLLVVLSAFKKATNNIINSGAAHLVKGLKIEDLENLKTINDMND